MVVRFRCLAVPAQNATSSKWLALAEANSAVARRFGFDGFLFRYSWKNNKPAGFDSALLEQDDCRFILSYDGEHCAIDANHLRFLFTALVSPGYQRAGSTPVLFVSHVESLEETRAFVNNLRRVADGSGLGSIFIVLEDVSVANFRAYGFDAVIGNDVPKIPVENSVDLIDYRANVAGAIVECVERAEQQNRDGAIICIEVNEFDEQVLQAQKNAIIDAATMIKALPGNVAQGWAAPAAQSRSTAGPIESDRAPSLSVATVVSGNPEATMATFTSVAENTPGIAGLDFTIVDNGSTDETQAMLRELGDAVSSVRNDVAKPLRDAWLQAYQQGEGDLVLLVSNDVVVEPGWLDPLVEEMRRDHGLIAVSPAIDTAGRRVPSQPPEVGTGVCLLIRRKSGLDQIPTEARFVASSCAQLQVVQRASV